MRGRAHSDDTKAKVIAALLAGCGVVEVAREMNIPHNTVSDYKKEIPEEQFDELRRKKGERLDDLVYDYLVQNLETLRAQSKAVSDEGYINQQPAGEMATLHGVIADKTIRLLEVTTSPSSPRQQLNPGPESNA